MVMEVDLTKRYRPTSRQIEAHKSPERYILYGGAVGGGKSAWLCNDILKLSLKYPGNSGYLCRHELQAFKRTTLLTLKYFLPSDLINNHHQSDHYYELINDSRIWYGGLGDDERGLDRLKSMDLGWFAIDQAEETTEEHFFMLASRLRITLPGIRYKGLMTANPDPGWLRDRFIDQKLDDHKFVPALPADNPYLPNDYEERLRELYPAALVRKWIEGHWDVDVASNYLIPYSKIREAINRRLPFVGDKVAGLDIARYGEDESVFTYRQGSVVLGIEAWSKQDITFTTGRTKQLIQGLEPAGTNIDVIGMGSGVFDPLWNENLNVKAVNVGEAAIEKEVYANLRAEAYKSLADRFENDDISIPNNPKLISQLASIKYKFDNHHRLQIMSKEEMRKKGIKSPDYADSLMLAFLDYVPEYAFDY